MKKTKKNIESIAEELKYAIRILGKEDLVALVSAEPKMRLQLYRYDRLTDSFQKLLKSISGLEILEDGGKQCFPALPIAKLLGIEAPTIHAKYEDWIEEFLIDLAITNKMIELTYFGDEMYLPMESVSFLVEFHTTFPSWIREKLILWIEAYCRERDARNLFLNAASMRS